MAKEKKKSAKEASKTFHDIMKASVKGKSMSTISATIKNVTCPFTYSITKTSDNQKIDRYWDFTVSHNCNNLPQIPKKFSFQYDTLNNVQVSPIEGDISLIIEKIIEKEGL